MDQPMYAITQEPIDDGDIRLVLSGEFDLDARDALLTSLLEAVRTCARCVVVDLDQVTFFDSGSIGTLVRGWSAARDTARSLEVVNAHGVVQRVLEVTGLLATLAGNGQSRPAANVRGRPAGDRHPIGGGQRHPVSGMSS